MWEILSHSDQINPGKPFRLNAKNNTLDLNRIGTPGQPQPLRPERNAPKYLPSPFAPVLTAIDPPVRARTPHRVRIITPDTVSMDESALTFTVRMVLDGRNGDDQLLSHSGSDPNALVESAEPFGLNCTLCQAACTPMRGQEALDSGLQTSIRASIPARSSG